jgi:type I restriction enzyme S subunit
MSDWTTVRLADVADIRFSNVDKKSIPGEPPVRLCNYMDVYANDYIAADLPFMEATASQAEIERFRAEAGDVMLTKDSETPDDIGIPAVVVEDIPVLVCGYHLALIKPKKDKVDSVYLAKQLGSKQTAIYFSKLANGSTRYGLSSSAIANTAIPLAPLPQQRRIAEILSTLDEAIEQTEALIAKMQQVKAGLMHDLFTRGVTPDGRLRPTREQAPELYKESPLGWIPKEWEVALISEAFDIQLGKMLNKLAKTGKGSAPYLGNRAVQWDFVDCTEIEVMDFTASERLKFSLNPGDLLVCEGGDVGRTAIWRGEMEGCFYQKAIHRLRPKSGAALPAFMLRFMRFAKKNGYFREFTSQSSIAHLTQEKLGAIPMLLPKLEEQVKIADRFDAIDDRIQGELLLLANSRQQKSGLMHDLLTGHVRAVEGISR